MKVYSIGQNFFELRKEYRKLCHTFPLAGNSIIICIGLHASHSIVNSKLITHIAMVALDIVLCTSEEQ